jgi:hypothetical protein
MARTSSEEANLRRAIEQQSGACRGLAIALRADADSRGPLQRHDKRLIIGWADSLDAIADGLTQALVDNDHHQLRWFLRAARAVAIPLAGISLALATGVGEGAGSAAFDLFTEDSAVSKCAARVVQTGEESDAAIQDWQAAVDDPYPELKTGSGPWESGDETNEILDHDAAVRAWEARRDARLAAAARRNVDE